MKKIFTLFVLFVFTLATQMPVMAATAAAHKVGADEVINSSTQIKLEFVDSLNINKSQVGEDVTFVLKEAIKDSGSTVIPKGTTFVGKITERQKSKWFYRRAYANISLNTMILPDGRTYYVSAVPKKDTLEAPAVLNAVKGVSTSALSGVVVLVGFSVLVVECVSVAGLVFTPLTVAAMGLGVSVTSKGLNYKVKAGTPITFVLKSPVRIGVDAKRNGVLELESDYQF